MASLQIETAVASAPIVSPADKYYNFFKYDMNKAVEIFPTGYTGVEVLEGQEGVAGIIKLWHYNLGGISDLSVKVLTSVIDDASKTIKFVALEGEVLELYSTFNVILTVSEGLAKWTIEYEKATILSPPPQLYITFFLTLSTLVDAYLLIN